MKILYFDCTNGISGDMLLRAMAELSGIKNRIDEAVKNERLHDHGGCGHDDEPGCGHGHAHGHDHGHAHGHGRGRSWLKVRQLIEHSGFSEAARETALCIYGNIAGAEAEVHGETLETIHFHEVGRDEAIKNTLGTGMALEAVGPDMVLTSPIYDGKGTIVCSHGEIPVPVPAVMALRAKCAYDFRRADVNTEMVTPSGLAGLMGIGAVPSDKTLQQLLDGAVLTARAEAPGGRNTGRDGLKVYLIQTD